MVKRSTVKRLSSTTSTSQPTSNSIDIKARKRIEELYEITDEIVDAYNEINEKYVNQIYRKYKQLQEKLKEHHCTGCKCKIPLNEEEEEESESSAEEEEEVDEEQSKTPAVPSSTTSSTITRSKKNNPFLISDIEETQNFDTNDSRFNKNMSDDEDANKPTKNESEQESEEEEAAAEEDDEGDEDEEGNEDNGMDSLPIALQEVIRRKAKKNKNAKAYLLEIPRYPALCEFLRDKSRTSFDHRPSEAQVRPLISNHLSNHLANNSKMRMRLRDELREIHRSYMRTFMNDPRAIGQKSSVQKTKTLSMKKSPK